MSLWIFATRAGQDRTLQRLVVGTVRYQLGARRYRSFRLTNCTDQSLSIGVDFPAAWPPLWKSTLVYMPAFSSFKLLKARLKETWNTKSIRRGFLTTGWEGSRKLDSPEIIP